MTPELEKQLYAKYPRIFRQKELNMTQTCMCWGIECGDGWFALLDVLCGNLQSMTDNNTHSPERFPQIEATQVKEKYGTLRFYTNVSSEYQDGAISFAECMSGHICDVCGNPGVLTGESWLATRCPDHLGDYA